MMRILRFLVVAFLVFLGITEVIPWIRNRVDRVTVDKIVGRPETLEGAAAACVYMARDASDLVTDEIRAAKPPPGDSSGWAEAEYEIQHRVAEAQDACACAEPGCDSALRALEEVAALVEDVNLMIGGQARFSGALVQRQERIEALLQQARVESR